MTQTDFEKLPKYRERLLLCPAENYGANYIMQRTRTGETMKIPLQDVFIWGTLMQGMARQQGKQVALDRNHSHREQLLIVETFHPDPAGLLITGFYTLEGFKARFFEDFRGVSPNLITVQDTPVYKQLLKEERTRTDLPSKPGLWEDRFFIGAICVGRDATYPETRKTVPVDPDAPEIFMTILQALRDDNALPPARTTNQERNK